VVNSLLLIITQVNTGSAGVKFQELSNDRWELIQLNFPLKPTPVDPELRTGKLLTASSKSSSQGVAE